MREGGGKIERKYCLEGRGGGGGGERERERERETERGGGGGEKNCPCVCVRGEERGEYRAVALLQAPHFCQQWHLYLLNALLMPRHVCCCKLLLRPILDDEEEGAEMGPGVLRFFALGHF